MENGPFEDVFVLKMGMFHCYVSLPEGRMQKKKQECHPEDCPPIFLRGIEGFYLRGWPSRIAVAK